jgi:hypothetical protein
MTSTRDLRRIVVARCACLLCRIVSVSIPCNILTHEARSILNYTYQYDAEGLGYLRGMPTYGAYDEEARPTTTSSPRKVHVCGPIVTYDSSKYVKKRLDLFNPTITVYAWPSGGGVIVLEHTSPADFDFLGVDRLDPPLQRYETREEEDVFCQMMLLLGAKWWDSMTRFHLLTSESTDMHALCDSDETESTKRERYWVSIAWPSTGGLVVAEWDTMMYGFTDENELVPMDVLRLLLCTNMDEKVHMLEERVQGNLWSSVEE